MKRKRKSSNARGSTKRQRTAGDQQPPITPLLEQYYDGVHSLRTYLVSRLPKTAKKRRRRLIRYGLQPAQDESILVERSVVELLDSILVGTGKNIPLQDLDQLDADLSAWTQQVSETDISVSPSTGRLRQSEVGLTRCRFFLLNATPSCHRIANQADQSQIVDFVISSLFRRHTGSYRPSHVLCDGFQRSAGTGGEARAVPGLPGIFAKGENPHVQELRNPPWSSLPDLLGRGAERVLSEMLMNCGLYRPIHDSSNVRQICGIPLDDLKTVQKQAEPQEANLPVQDSASFAALPKKRQLSDIRFLRHRMLYAKPSLKSNGKVRFGMTHAHVMRRYRNLTDPAETIHVMKYVFPRQFDLHNVFTSSTDVRNTSHQLMDYTVREQEIARVRTKRKYRSGKPALLGDKVPRRLRGKCFRLVERLRKRESRCSYRTLLDHHCPRSQHGTSDQDSTFDKAAPLGNVSAFCRAAIRHVFPLEFFGDHEGETGNFAVVTRCVDNFVRLRRYETTSLHDVMQGITLSDIQWPASAKADQKSNMSRSDFETRKDIMSELLYYVFDSYLIPLIRSHFYVTESSAHRNQLFYFRHDLWQSLSEPALNSLKLEMFEECSAVELGNAMAQRALGVSKVRLLPKEVGMRPIINLRRRVQRHKNGPHALGKSINSILTPAFSILNYEKTSRPGMVGSALFSVDDMFTRLQSFRTSLSSRGPITSPLYFAKVDVRSCFDTIPQKRLLILAKHILSANEYHLTRYSRAKLLGGHNKETPGFGAKPSWKYLTKATTEGSDFDLDAEIRSESIAGRTRTAYVGGVVQRSEYRRTILDLLHEHIQSNIVKLGKRLYRQKEGIPQGSILSSLLCSYFYTELEKSALGFVNNESSLLMRLIDDFLIITTDRHVAETFMRTMHAGLPEFGVQVKADKSRANFDISIDGSAIDRLPAETDFPYCGNAINTTTLDLSKDMQRRKTTNIQDSITVEFSKLPGQTFYRKTLNALKLYMRTMYLSTSYNSVTTVLTNLYCAFDEVAKKSYSYIKSLPSSKQPASKLMISKS
jgi:telomerase reverse transcriptase